MESISYPRESHSKRGSQEVGNVLEGGGGNLEHDPEGGTASVACERDPTKSGYFNFDLDRIYTINW